MTASLAFAGAAAVAVPVFIHLLLRRRRAPVEWAAMRFLIEAYRRHRRRLRLEEWLLLLVRCLIPLLLGFALARPILEQAIAPTTERPRCVYFIVDDGLASGLRDAAHRSALARQLELAEMVVEHLNAADRVGVITAARPARMVRTPTGDHESIGELFESLRPRAGRTDLGGAFERLKHELSRREVGDENVVVYLLSEFRAGSVDPVDPLPVLPVPDAGGVAARFFASPPASGRVRNVQVVGIEPARNVLLVGAAEEAPRATVRLVRPGADAGSETTRVRLTGDQSPIDEEQIVQWEPGEIETQLGFAFDVGAPAERELVITAEIGEDPLVADNRYHLVLPVRKRIEVVLLDRREFGFEPTLDRLSAGQWIRRALAPDAGGPVTMRNVEPVSLTVGDVQGVDAVIVPRPDLLSDRGWAVLRRFVDRGGLLLITPPQDESVHGWVDHLQADLALPWTVAREVRDEAPGLPVSDDVPPSELLRQISGDLPELVQPVRVQRFLPVATAADRTLAVRTSLRLSDGSPLILTGSPGAAKTGEGRETPRSSLGLVILFTAAPELGWTNLPTKPLMVPLFQELLRQGLSLRRGGKPAEVGDAAIGGALAMHPAAAGLVSPDGATIDVQPGGRLARAVSQAGVHRVLGSTGREIGRLAVNVDPAGGDPTPQAAGAVKAWLDRSAPWAWLDESDPLGAGTASGDGSSLASLLLVFLLAVIVLETIMARLFSRASLRLGRADARGIRPSMDERSPLISSEGGS
ncbi:MAG: BatA domain-containing protein [Planctomycetota bacterium]|nr:BatA domain-containing protein [Planctomycetota bacterium]